MKIILQFWIAFLIVHVAKSGIALSKNMRWIPKRSLPDPSLPNPSLPDINLPDHWLPDQTLPKHGLPDLIYIYKSKD